MTKRALLVARVSTDAQAKHGYSLPTQLEAMRKYAHANGFEIVGEVTDDCSGSIPIYDRPGGQQIYQAVKARSVDVIVFFTIDRASRDEDVIDFIMLKRDLREAGIELHFADTGRSEHDSTTGIIEYIRVSEAGRERKKILERTERGKRAKAASGKWVGGGNPPYGYWRMGEKRDARLVIDEAETAIVRRIFEMFVGAYGQPMGIRTIAAVLTEEGVPTPIVSPHADGAAGADSTGSPDEGQRPGDPQDNKKNPGRRGIGNAANGWYAQTIKNILKRRAYIGEFENYGQPLDLPDLAIIDRQTFDAAQVRLMQSRALTGMYERKYETLLSGRITCACDKCMVSHVQHRGRYRYYRCLWASHERHMRKCTEPLLRADLADAIVWDWFEGLLRDEEQLNEGLTKYGEKREEELQPKRERLAQLDAEIAEAERQIKALAAEFSKEKDEFVAATLREQQKIAARKRAAGKAARAIVLNELTRAELSEQDKAQILEWAAEVREELGELTFEKRRILFGMTDLQAKVEYRYIERGLFVTCGLKPDREWLSVEKDMPVNARTGA